MVGLFTVFAAILIVREREGGREGGRGGERGETERGREREYEYGIRNFQQKKKIRNNIEERYYNIILYKSFRSRLVHLQHSNVINLFTVCALSYKVYCAYTPSNGVMAWPY